MIQRSVLTKIIYYKKSQIYVWSGIGAFPGSVLMNIVDFFIGTVVILSSVADWASNCRYLQEFQFVLRLSSVFI